MFRHWSQRLRWLALLLCVAGLANAAHAQEAQGPGLFDRLFGSEAAADKSGKASDGLSLPSFFADGKLVADALPLHDLGPDEGACVAIVPLLDALEVRYERSAATGDLAVTLPDPRRTVTLPADVLLPSPSGDCIPLSDIPRYFPFSLKHDSVSQRLLLKGREPLPVLMRLVREERQARIRTEAVRPAFPLLAPPAPPPVGVRLWSADLSSNLAWLPQGLQTSGNLLVSGELIGLAGRLSLSMTPKGQILPGFTISEARDMPDLLGPLGARSVVAGDVVAPSQPLINGAMTGRGLVVSSRAPWRADLVDEITLSGPLPSGWEAELWHEERLIAVARTPDAAGNWQFGGLPVRLGENRWTVRLYGPHGEVNEQVFNRLVGAAMNAENEVDYTFGVVDSGRPLLGQAIGGAPTGGAAFVTVGWGVTSNVTARLDAKAGANDPLAIAVGLNGTLGGGLWSATAVQFAPGSYGGAIRFAREFGAQDIVLDIARHGGDVGQSVPPQVREFAQTMALSGQGRIGWGRLSLPWQARLESSELRGRGSRHLAAARLVLPIDDWQANLALGAIRNGNDPWQATAALGFTARQGDWRLRSGITAAYQRRWQIEGASLSASRNLGNGSMAVNASWQAESGDINGGLTFSQQFGPLGVSASIGQEGQGWAAGIGLTIGLWKGPRGWRPAQAGVTRGGAILAELFVDEDADGLRDADEVAIEGGRMIVGAALRRESSGADGDLLIRGLPTGPSVDIETQLSSLQDFTLRPARAGDRIVLRPGEVRAVSVPLRPTGSVQAQVVLVAGDQRTPRSGVRVTLRDPTGQEVARAVTDFDGYVLFDGLSFGTWKVEASGQISPALELSRERPDQLTRLLIPPADETQ